MKSTEIIELNVGGTVYTTTRTTLTSYPNSMLYFMISSGMSNATDSKQRIFIDRDGLMFRFILNFLRDKQLNLPANFSEYTQLRQEADFFGIEPIINELNERCDSQIKALKTNEKLLRNFIPTKGIYLTIISKLHSGTLETILGCITVLKAISSLEKNSKLFLNNLSNSNFFSSFICECKFMRDEKIICCKSCGLENNNNDNKNLNSMCQLIAPLAKKFGITTGYWEQDVFYLSLQTKTPNREAMSASLNEIFNGKLVSSCVCNKRTNGDDSMSSLVERWYIPDLTLLKNT
jgi:hypothetical protein